MPDVPASEPPTSPLIAIIQGTTAVPKLVAKLIDTVGEQVGLFLEPYHIRRKGQAEADVTVAETKAKAQITVLRLENKLTIRDLEDRAEERVRVREAKRQENLEAITAQAAREIPEEVSEQPVEEDWVSQFFNHCQDVSDEQMQVLWARLLAGEVAKPGSFSLRTLGFVRTFSKQDADLFTRACSMLWQMGRDLQPFTPELAKLKNLPGIELEFTDLVRLEALGLIRFESVSDYQVQFSIEKPGENTPAPSDYRLIWHYYGLPHVLSMPSTKISGIFLSVDVGKALFTDIGSELALVSGSKPNEQYRQIVVSELRQRGWEVSEPWTTTATT